MEDNTIFWEYLEKLVKDNEMVIDRPKGTKHPKYENMVYIADYGYVKNTTFMDNSGIDIFLGTLPSKNIDSIICIIDLMKKDSEIKILMGCTKTEKVAIYNFLNNSEYMKALMVKRSKI